MIEAMHTAIAGLRSNSTRLGTAAENIVNARSSGRLDIYDGYKPKVFQQTTDAVGRPRAVVKTSDTPFFPAYAPNDPSANGDGIVGMPNVSLPSQFVEFGVAQRSYAANIAVLEATNEMVKLLVDRDV